MTMGLRNKVISFKENVAQIRDGISTAKSTGNVSRLDEVLKSVDTMEEALLSFTLEKERRERKQQNEEETIETAEA